MQNIVEIKLAIVCSFSELFIPLEALAVELLKDGVIQIHSVEPARRRRQLHTCTAAACWRRFGSNRNVGVGGSCLLGCRLAR